MSIGPYINVNDFARKLVMSMGPSIIHLNVFADLQSSS